MRKVYSEAKLALADLWFTGKEWANGTASRILRQQYNARQAEVAAQESNRKANPPAKVYESGLSPIQACAKAMRQDVKS